MLPIKIFLCCKASFIKKPNAEICLEYGGFLAAAGAPWTFSESFTGALGFINIHTCRFATQIGTSLIFQLSPHYAQVLHHVQFEIQAKLLKIQAKALENATISFQMLHFKYCKPESQKPTIFKAIVSSGSLLLHFRYHVITV